MVHVGDVFKILCGAFKLLIAAIDVLHNAFSVPVASLLLMVSV
jgi:hypothetical protein